MADKPIPNLQSTTTTLSGRWQSVAPTIQMGILLLVLVQIGLGAMIVGSPFVDHAFSEIKRHSAVRSSSSNVVTMAQ